MKRIGSLLAGFCLWIFLFTSMGSAQQVQFDATVNQNTVAKDDNFTLTLTVSSDGNVNLEEPRLPDLNGFELLNKWSQSQSSSMYENGKFQFIRKQIFKYTLAPQKVGALTIGSAQVNVNGKTLTSKPIVIKVLAPGNRPQGGSGQPQVREDDDDILNPPGGMFGDEDDLFSQLLKRRGLTPDRRGGIKSAPQGNRDAFFISVETDKRKVYVGEEVIASWYIYTRGSIQAFDALKYPELKGFWKEDLELAQRLNFQSEVVNGIPYNKALLVSYALFPISPGKKTVDAYKAKATVISMDSSMSMFGLGHPYTYVKVSKELPLEVIPLPVEGRPASFSGAVGRFNISGSLSATQVKVNQPLSLKIRFSGVGNVKAIELPPVDLPKNLEIYDTKKDSQFSKNGDGFKEFELIIIPRSQGQAKVQPIAVSYFDPKTAKYVVNMTPEFNINVLPGDGSSQSNLNSPMAQSGQSNEGSGKEVNYLKTTSTIGFPAPVHFMLWLLLFGGTWGWFIRKFLRINTSDKYDQAILVKKRAQYKLRMARAKLKKGDWRGVGVECSNAILSSLGEISGFGGASRSAEQMIKNLKSGDPNLGDEILKILNRCEVISFAPDALIQSQKSDGELQKVIEESDKVIAQIFLAARHVTSEQPVDASM